MRGAFFLCVRGGEETIYARCAGCEMRNRRGKCHGGYLSTIVSCRRGGEGIEKEAKVSFPKAETASSQLHEIIEKKGIGQPTTVGGGGLREPKSGLVILLVRRRTLGTGTPPGILRNEGRENAGGREGRKKFTSVRGAVLAGHPFEGVGHQVPEGLHSHV